MCSFRTCNHHLPIESGCWVNIPRNERICNLCNKQEVWDVFNTSFNVLLCKNKECDIYRQRIPKFKKNGLSLNRLFKKGGN